MPIAPGFLDVSVEQSSALCTGCHLHGINDLEAIDPRLFWSLVSPALAVEFWHAGPFLEFPIDLDWLWIVPMAGWERAFLWPPSRGQDVLISADISGWFEWVHWHSYLKQRVICTVWELFTNFGKQPHWLGVQRGKIPDVKQFSSKPFLQSPCCSFCCSQRCGPGVCVCLLSAHIVFLLLVLIKGASHPDRLVQIAGSLNEPVSSAAANNSKYTVRGYVVMTSLLAADY